MIIGRDSARLRSNTGQGRMALVNAAVTIAETVYSLVIIVKYVVADRVRLCAMTCKLLPRQTHTYALLYRKMTNFSIFVIQTFVKSTIRLVKTRTTRRVRFAILLTNKIDICIQLFLTVVFQIGKCKRLIMILVSI